MVMCGNSANNNNSKSSKKSTVSKQIIKGCLDKKANNYNFLANKSDGSCKYNDKEQNDFEVFIEYFIFYIGYSFLFF